MLRTFADYATFPLLLVGAYVAASLLLSLGVHTLLVTPLVVGPIIAVTWCLERLRPERHQPTERDVPLITEGAHFIFNFEFGYGLALLASLGVETICRASFAPLWPAAWPLPLQLLLALACYEVTSYWQHRWFHRVPRLWRFHALHHGGGYLDLVRAGRFHFVDFASAAFAAYLPLVILGAPEDVVTLMAVVVSALGLSQHANFRSRSPGWLDWLICTPAVHRRHHAKAFTESDVNFGNTLMIFDVLFGTYAKPDPIGPKEIGSEDDPLPRGFWRQLLTPFRRS